MAKHPGGAKYRLELVAVPDDHAPPPARLKAVLKLLLRRFGFRCKSVEEVPAPPPPVAQEAPGDVEATVAPLVAPGTLAPPPEAAEGLP